MFLGGRGGGAAAGDLGTRKSSPKLHAGEEGLWTKRENYEGGKRPFSFCPRNQRPLNYGRKRSIKKKLSPLKILGSGGRENTRGVWFVPKKKFQKTKATLE